MNEEMGTLCSECGDKEPERGRRVCAACRKRGQRQKATPDEISALLDEAESYGCRIDRENGLVWRPLSPTAAKNDPGGEWVIPHACKHGVHLKPACERIKNG